MADATYLTIGKVVKRLQERYPDLSVSKVRYLEDEGLLSPSRSTGGYRQYSQHDIQRLETILHLQKTRFLPLSIIKEELNSNLTGESSHLAADQSEAAYVGGASARIDPAATSKLHPIEKLPELIDVSVGFVRQLAEVGVITLQRSPHGRDLIDGRDLKLIATCDSLRHYGFGPKNLRQYVQAARRESGVFEQALVPYAHKGSTTAPPTDEIRRQFNRAFAEMLMLTDQVRDALISRQIRHTYQEMEAQDTESNSST